VKDIMDSLLTEGLNAPCVSSLAREVKPLDLPGDPAAARKRD
jgi:hypothetical protein